MIQSHTHWDLKRILESADAMMKPDGGVCQFAVSALELSLSLAESALDIRLKAVKKLNMKIRGGIVTEIHNLINFDFL